MQNNNICGCAEDIYCNRLAFVAPEVLCVREGSDAARKLLKARMSVLAVNIGLIFMSVVVMMGCGIVAVTSKSKETMKISLEGFEVVGGTALFLSLAAAFNYFGCMAMRSHATKILQDDESTQLRS